MSHRLRESGPQRPGAAVDTSTQPSFWLLLPVAGLPGARVEVGILTSARQPNTTAYTRFSGREVLTRLRHLGAPLEAWCLSLSTRHRGQVVSTAPCRLLPLLRASPWLGFEDYNSPAQRFSKHAAAGGLPGLRVSRNGGPNSHQFLQAPCQAQESVKHSTG